MKDVNILLRLQDIWLNYAEKPVLQGLSMNIEKGQVYGLLGINGAGKSTVMRTILGLVAIDKGDIEWNIKPKMVKVGGVIESPRLYTHLTVEKHLRMFANYHGVPTNQALKWLETVDLIQHASVSVQKCSLGMRQRLILALTLMPQPQLVVLDEPSNGLDPLGQKELYRIIKHISHQHQTAFLISSHHFEEVEMMADKVGILHEGKLCWEGTLKDASKSAIFTFRATARPIVQRLLSSHQKKFEWLGCEQVKIPVTFPTDIAKLSRFFVMHGVELLGVEPQQPSLADIYWQHTQMIAV